MRERHSRLPLDVQQLFETAKNVSLYTWFVYRFHQVSEMVGYAALEMALRKKYYAENPQDDPKNNPKKRPKMLNSLMSHAVKKNWLSNYGFSGARRSATMKAEHDMFQKAVERMELEDKDSMPVEEPTEQQILKHLENLDYVDAVAENTPKVRNFLAHGSSTLSPTSVGTLKQIAEIINQLYKK